MFLGERRASTMPRSGVFILSAVLIVGWCATGLATPPYEQSGSDATGIDDWWPNRLDLRPLKRNAPAGDPMDDSFDYAEAFSKVDYDTLKQDIEKVLTTSQEWWPADQQLYCERNSLSGAWCGPLETLVFVSQS